MKKISKIEPGDLLYLKFNDFSTDICIIKEIAWDMMDNAPSKEILIASLYFLSDKSRSKLISFTSTKVLIYRDEIQKICKIRTNPRRK